MRIFHLGYPFSVQNFSRRPDRHRPGPLGQPRPPPPSGPFPTPELAPKKARNLWRLQAFKMAGWTGLEPATFCVTGRRSGLRINALREVLPLSWHYVTNRTLREVTEFARP